MKVSNIAWIALAAVLFAVTILCASDRKELSAADKAGFVARAESLDASDVEDVLSDVSIYYVPPGVKGRAHYLGSEDDVLTVSFEGNPEEMFYLEEVELVSLWGGPIDIGGIGDEFGGIGDVSINPDSLIAVDLDGLSFRFASQEQARMFLAQMALMSEMDPEFYGLMKVGWEACVDIGIVEVCKSWD